MAIYLRRKRAEKVVPLKPCPVCGKKPKLYADFNFYGNFGMVRCKPLFGKTHFSAYVGKASPDFVIREVVKEWNDGVKDYKPEQKQEKS